MDILFLMLPLSFVLVSAIIGVAVWAVNSRQFDDLSSPAHRILDDSDEKRTDNRLVSESAGRLEEASE